MVIGYHVVLGAHGFWLPNDPRGSWSTYVWAKHLRQFGPATKVATRESVAAREHDRQLRFAAKKSLKYPAVKFTGLQALAVVHGFADLVGKLKIVVHACAILPDHAHLVLARRRGDVQEVAGMLLRAGTRSLNKRGINPMAKHRKPNGRLPSPWGDHPWCVFIDNPQQMHCAIEYVEKNPVKADLKPQRWGFVVPYEG